MEKIVFIALLAILLTGACTSDTSADTSPPELSDSTMSPSPFGGGLGRGPYPTPDPFPGQYLNDPSREGFDRQLTIDSTGPTRYRVRFLSTELDGSLLCRHEATFERRDTLELVGSIEGSELRIRSREAALEVVPADGSLLRNPGILCPGASIFGWWLPQWTREAPWPDTLSLPTRDEWLAPDLLRDFNAAMTAAGQPDLVLRYETEILTRGDYDADGNWEYPVLLRDDSGRLGLFVYRRAGEEDRFRRVAALDETTSGEPADYLCCGLDTEPAGTVFYDWSTRESFTLPRPGILLQYYESATSVFFLQGGRWRMIQISE